MYCRECGAKIRDGDRFCPKCGAKVEPASTTMQDSDASRSGMSPSGGIGGQVGETGSELDQGDSFARMGRDRKGHPNHKVLIALAVAVAAVVVAWRMGLFTMGASGNTSGNITNDGLAAEQSGLGPVEGWTYFVSTSSSGWSIHKISSDGTGSTGVVCSASSTTEPRYLNVVGNEVYFMSKGSSNSYSICKVGTDGTGEKTIWSAPSGTSLDDLDVTGGKAYFMSDDSSGNDSICKVSLDGTGESAIWSVSGKDTLYCLDVIDSEAYFLGYDSSSGWSVDQVGTDGTSKKTLWSAPSGTSLDCLNVVDDKAYFLGYDFPSCAIMKVNTDGTGELNLKLPHFR